MHEQQEAGNNISSYGFDLEKALMLYAFKVRSVRFSSFDYSETRSTGIDWFISRDTAAVSVSVSSALSVSCPSR